MTRLTSSRKGLVCRHPLQVLHWCVQGRSLVEAKLGSGPHLAHVNFPRPSNISAAYSTSQPSPRRQGQKPGTRQGRRSNRMTAGFASRRTRIASSNLRLIASSRPADRPSAALRHGVLVVPASGSSCCPPLMSPWSWCSSPRRGRVRVWARRRDPDFR